MTTSDALRALDARIVEQALREAREREAIRAWEHLPDEMHERLPGVCADAVAVRPSGGLLRLLLGVPRKSPLTRRLLAARLRKEEGL
jgi:hypothetical protein